MVRRNGKWGKRNILPRSGDLPARAALRHIKTDARCARNAIENGRAMAAVVESMLRCCADFGSAGALPVRSGADFFRLENVGVHVLAQIRREIDA